MENDELRELRTMADTVREALDDASRMQRGTELRRLVGIGRIAAELQRLEPLTRRSAWNLQPRLRYDPEDVGPALTETSHRRGIDLQLVTRPATLRENPLLPSMYPSVRVGPVFLRALILDEQIALIEGLDTVEGEPTAWLTDRMDFVVPVLEIWQQTLARSTPVLDVGEKPPLSPRQVKVARLLATGQKDQAIARQLDMSARTVERDVRAILAALGAGSRTEAVLAMTGRGYNSGRRPQG